MDSVAAWQFGLTPALKGAPLRTHYTDWHQNHYSPPLLPSFLFTFGEIFPRQYTRELYDCFHFSYGLNSSLSWCFCCCVSFIGWTCPTPQMHRDRVSGERMWHSIHKQIDWATFVPSIRTLKNSPFSSYGVLKMLILLIYLFPFLLFFKREIGVGAPSIRLM